MHIHTDTLNAQTHTFISVHANTYVGTHTT